MSRFGKLSIILSAIVAMFIGSLVGYSAINTAEAGGGPDNIRFEVTPSTKNAAGVWSDTQVFYRAVSSTQVIRGNWSRYTSGSQVTTTIGPEGTTANMVGDPYHMYYSFGTYLSYPDGTHNGFASTQWFSTTDYCVAPRVSISITNPRTLFASGKATVDNRAGSDKLFASEDEGRTWTDVPIGDFYASKATNVGKVWVKTQPTSTVGDYSTYACSITQWNLTSEWIDGATPTPSPTPTPTATATPGPQQPVVKVSSPNSSWRGASWQQIKVDVSAVTLTQVSFTYTLGASCGTIDQTREGVGKTPYSNTFWVWVYPKKGPCTVSFEGTNKTAGGTFKGTIQTTVR